MSKHSGKKDREDKARRRLVKAQLDLHAAQEKRAHAITRAEHEMERAKQRGSKWVANATERVERRSGAMAQAEAHLLAITSPKHPRSPRMEDVPPQTTAPSHGPELTVSSPTAAADVLEERESEVAAQREAGPLTIPDSIPIDPPNASNGNEASEEGQLRPW
jgi:hypothetical protein